MNKPFIIYLYFCLFLVACTSGSRVEKSRLIVTTDIGGDPDDQQSMVRLLVYANDFDLEGLIASASGTPGELNADTIKPQLIEEMVSAYGKVYDNLVKHDPDYPEPTYLRGLIKQGNPRRGVENVGEGHDTEGSDWIIEMADKADSRPLNISIWGGSTDLAQAIWRVENDRTPEEFTQFVNKLRVYSIHNQDNTGEWINENYPELFYVLSRSYPGKDKRTGNFRGMYMGGDESLTSRKWVEENVKTDHGPLGSLYPMKTWTAPNPHGVLKEGDTPSFFYFLYTGLNDPAHPEWGSWGGRFVKTNGNLYRDLVPDQHEAGSARSTVWRWRPYFQNDFAARMDRCVKGFDEVNHNPVAVLNSDQTQRVLRKLVKPGDEIELDATGSSDPDEHAITYKWWILDDQPELILSAPDQTVSTLKIPEGFRSGQIHVILEVSDNGDPQLTSFRRLVLNVQ